MKRKVREYSTHKCPRCQEMTNRKCYCELCLTSIRTLPRFSLNRSHVPSDDYSRFRPLFGRKAANDAL